MKSVRDPIRVLIVDDSPVVRQVLTRLLSADPAIGLVDTAPNASVALRKIAKLDPDVVTLDVQMPTTDGLTLLRQIMAERPRPVLMVSALTHEGAEQTLRALALGAVDFIPKPVGRLSRDIAQVGSELREKVVAVASLRHRLRRRSAQGEQANATVAAGATGRQMRRLLGAQPKVSIVAVGASTGGTEAIRRLLSRLPKNFPAAVVVVQHMPAGFSLSYSKRLHEQCQIEVKEAAHRDLIVPGRALLAPGHSHMRVCRGDEADFVELEQGPEVGGHRPAVDVLFDSLIPWGASTLGILLTGMGRDGASGLGRLRQAGAVTCAQDEESCVVYGMPRAALREDAVDLIGNPADLGEALAATLREPLAERTLGQPGKGGAQQGKDVGHGQRL